MKLERRRLYFPNEEFLDDPTDQFPLEFTLGFWLDIPLNLTILPPLKCHSKMPVNADNDSNNDDDLLIKIYLTSSCKVPYLKEGNFIGFCDPLKKAGLIVSIGERSHVQDKTLERKAAYPKWLPMEEESDEYDYDQTVCNIICKRLTMFWESKMKQVCACLHLDRVVIIPQCPIITQVTFSPGLILEN